MPLSDNTPTALGKHLYLYFNNAVIQRFDIDPGHCFIGLDRRGSLQVTSKREDLATPLARLELLKDGDTTIRAASTAVPLFVNNRPHREAPLMQGDELLLDGHLMIWGQRKDLSEYVLANESDVPALIVEDGPGESVHVDAVLPQSDWGTLRNLPTITGGDSYAVDKQHRQMSSLLLLSQEINTIFDLDALLEKCVEAIFNVLLVDRAAILLCDDTGKLDVSRVAFRRGRIPETIRIPESITQQAIERQAGLLVRNPLDNPRFQTKASVIEGKIQAAMAIPLARDNDLLGLVYADTSNPAVSFSIEDLRFLSILANLTTIALTNNQRLRRLEQRTKVLEASRRDTDVIIGPSGATRDMFRLLDRVADSQVTVLLTGESGTGKEVAAQYMHQCSARADKPFVAVNCAAIPDTLIESELFGHERGAFTGADSAKAGRFELADGGTLLLDEIGEIPPAFQAKLLRVLEGHGFERVGGVRTLKPKVRIITATNRNLRAAVSAGTFRQDLFYRLTVFPIHLPPLRQRQEDIMPLAEHFLEKFAQDMNRGSLTFSDAARDVLLAHPWPGNVRELRNLMERIVILADSEVVEPELLGYSLQFGREASREELSPLSVERPSDPEATIVGSWANGNGGIPPGADPEATMALPGFSETGERMSLWDQEVAIIKKALEQTRGNRSKAARLLGISRHHLIYRMKKYAIVYAKETGGEEA